MKPKFSRKLLKAKPYKIVSVGNGIGVTIGKLSGFKLGDKIYQEQLNNGIILIIPEKVWLEKNIDKTE